MAKYSYHRVDGNAEPLYEFLEAHGVTVKRTPGGPLDALAAVDGATAVIDIKTDKGKLEPRQVKFLKHWPGLAMIVRTEADCVRLVGLLRQMAGGIKFIQKLREL